jgi:hypothetical protein
VPHRGLLLASSALLATVFVRLALNPSIWSYEPRGNSGSSTGISTPTWLPPRRWAWPRGGCRAPGSRCRGVPAGVAPAPGAAVVLLFWLLNIEIADFYATGPQIMFRFGVTVSQDLTYTIGWLAFGMILLAVGIYARNRPARVTRLP